MQQVDQQLIRGIEIKILFNKFQFCYNSLISNDEEEEEERITPDETITIKKQKITTKEEAQMIRARAFLNRLDNKVQEKDDLVKKIRYSYV